MCIVDSVLKVTFDASQLACIWINQLINFNYQNENAFNLKLNEFVIARLCFAMYSCVIIYQFTKFFEVKAKTRNLFMRIWY